MQSPNTFLAFGLWYNMEDVCDITVMLLFL